MNVCTIVTKQYWSFARTLAKSVLALHPSAQVYVLLADQVDGHFDPTAEPFHTIFLEDLGNTETIKKMSFYYTAFEFCCALRGFLHDYMWHKTSATEWVFLDSDIYVVGDLSDIVNSLGKASLLLNPHNTSPATPEFFLGGELVMLKHGIFNGGFLGLRRCEDTRLFISWFIDRLSRYCFLGVPGLFVDQLWLNHVPNYFKNVASYTHPGANLAHWNLYKRTLRKDAQGRYLADDLPLMFVHFTGWDIDLPGEVSKHELGYRNMPIPQLQIWKELGEQYRADLLSNGYLQARHWPYAFDKLPDGRVVTPEMRRKYYKDLFKGVQHHVSPFPPVS
ncbi:MAG: glycosyl transferase, group 1 [Planctomycetota bacterium]|nr:glycosyl transferase, group 1 [Planctomycetota bacterium]